MSDSRWILTLVVLLAGLQGALFALVVPPWQAPDEPGHFGVALLDFQYGRVATWNDTGRLPGAVIASMNAHRFYEYVPWAEVDKATSGIQLGQPPLYYWLLSWTLRGTAGQPIETQLLVMRLGSVLLSMAAVAAAGWTAQIAFPSDEFMQVSIPAFFALLPMRGFIAGSVNNDNLAVLLATLGILAMTWGVRRGWNVWSGAAVGLALLLGFWTKRSVLILAPALPFALVPAGWRLRLDRRRPAWWLGAGLALVLVAGGLVYYWPSIYHTLVRTTNPPDWTAIASALAQNGVRYAQIMARSFWGWFGWLTLELPKPYAWIFRLFYLAVGLGWLKFAWRAWRTRTFAPADARLLLLYAVLLAVTLFGVALAFGLYATDPALEFSKNDAPQGRYLFPVLVPLAAIAMLGLREWIPTSRRRAAALALLLALVLFNVNVVGSLLLPYFYG